MSSKPVFALMGHDSNILSYLVISLQAEKDHAVASTAVSSASLNV